MTAMAHPAPSQPATPATITRLAPRMSEAELFTLMSHMSGADFKLYWYFCYRSGKNGFCWPSAKRIAKDLGISKPTVLAARANLEALGLIQVVESDDHDSLDVHILKRLPFLKASEDPTDEGVKKLDPPGQKILPPPVKKFDPNSVKGNSTNLTLVSSTAPSAAASEQSDDQEPSTEPDGFDAFWEAYPRKVGKGAARKAWAKLKPTAELAARILNALEVAKKSAWVNAEIRFIPHPTTWLNQERWEDELPAAAAPAPIAPSRIERSIDDDRSLSVVIDHLKTKGLNPIQARQRAEAMPIEDVRKLARQLMEA